MTFLIVAKLIHIASAILFIRCVYFRTLILPVHVLRSIALSLKRWRMRSLLAHV